MTTRPDVSVIIPSRAPQYLQKTVDDLLKKSETDIEIIVVLDGYWPDPPVHDNKRVKLLHHGTVHDHFGMRESINRGIRISRGKYLMKTDEHCMFEQGFDKKLIADCEADWLVIPRRERLDAEKWELIKDGRPAVDYMHITYPYERPYDRRCGLYGGGIDKQRTKDRADVLIDDVMAFQGSCYFLHRKYWDQIIGHLETENYGTFNHEAQEVGFKVWLSGGRVVVNKKTWYAHYHKGKNGKGYNFSTEQYRRHELDKEKARRYCLDFWLKNKWDRRVHDFEWLVDKFWPVPGWPQDWKTRIWEDAKHDWANDPSKQPSEWLNPNDLKNEKQN